MNCEKMFFLRKIEVINNRQLPLYSTFDLIFQF